MRILMIEDDAALCEAVGLHLKKNGYQTDFCQDGEDGYYHALQGAYDLILLDRMLPGLDGVALLQALRRQNVHTPVLMLTALSGIGDRVAGLDAGADDYLTKPFATEELLARVRAMLRRTPALESQEALSYADVQLDTTQLLLTGPQDACSLSKKEAALLEILLKNPQRTLSRNLLFSHVWGAGAEVEEANLDGYVYFLRRRFTGIGSRLRLRTIRGVGFRLEDGSSC